MALAEDTKVLVTGASSGIGAALVARLAARGHEVHALARRRDRLDALVAETGAHAHVIDLLDTARLHELVESIGADVVVNNAGLGRAFEDVFRAGHDDIDTTIDTNVKTVLHLLRAALPGMIERGRGHVVNVGSTAGLHPVKSSVYGASKGAIHMMGMNLRVELAGTGVRVTEICPGRVDTEFFDVAVDDDALRERLLDTGIKILEAGDVADAIVFALDAPAHVNVSLIELQPTEQVYGGTRFAPAGG